MASKQLLNPMRRAIAQKVRPTFSSVCVQCQQRWQSKVSQRPGSDRYGFALVLRKNNELTITQCSIPRRSEQPVHDQAFLQPRN
jgi:uncharacterized protein YlaI